MKISSREYDHALVELCYAEAYKCVRCEQVFGPTDKVTFCPNAVDGSHALVPARKL